MVTRKRRIETEEDRFGGFAEENQYSRSRAFQNQTDTFTVPDDSPALSQKEYSEANLAYSTRESERIFARPTQVRERKADRTGEDIMPSIKTMSYIEKQSAEKPKHESRERMEGKTKMMLTVYMVIVVLLAAVVIGTGVAINAINRDVSALQYDIGTMQTAVSQQDTQLAFLNDPDYLAGRAYQKDMIDDGSAQYIDLVPLKENNPYAARTNWFDKFCDWLGRIIGG